MGQKALLMAGLLTVALSACGGPLSMEEPAGGEGARSGSQALQSEDGSDRSVERSCAVLYIGVGNQFAEYPVEYTGELDENGQIPPEEVLAAMASLTGWPSGGTEGGVPCLCRPPVGPDDSGQPEENPPVLGGGPGAGGPRPGGGLVLRGGWR